MNKLLKYQIPTWRSLRPLRDTVFLILFATISLCAQEVKNIRVSQMVNRVNIRYDLVGEGKSYSISLYYTLDDGKTWTGPLKNVKGDVGEYQKPGFNCTIVWDALTEKGPIEGLIQFKVVAELSEEGMKAEAAKKIKEEPEKPIAKPWLKDEKFKRAKSSKTLWFTSALVTAGIGTLSYMNGRNLYDKYYSAGNEADDIQRKIIMSDRITSYSFGISGGCCIGCIFSLAKQAKIKKEFKIHADAFPKGASLMLSFNF